MRISLSCTGLGGPNVYTLFPKHCKGIFTNSSSETEEVGTYIDRKWEGFFHIVNELCVGFLFIYLNWLVSLLNLDFSHKMPTKNRLVTWVSFDSFFILISCIHRTVCNSCSVKNCREWDFCNNSDLYCIYKHITWKSSKQKLKIFQNLRNVVSVHLDSL